jgi:hypothetical protein
LEAGATTGPVHVGTGDTLVPGCDTDVGAEAAIS